MTFTFTLLGELFQRNLKCSGRKLLEDTLGHLKFDQDEAEKNEILDRPSCAGFDPPGGAVYIPDTSRHLPLAPTRHPAALP